MTKQPRIALLGIGRWGRNLARNFHQLGALHTICDASPETLAECQRLYPGVQLTSDSASVLRDTEIEAVAIATPAITHYALASAALSAGKHTFVEKPMALDHAEGEALVRLAEDNQRTLMVGHLLLHHPAVTTLLSIIRQGELGDISYLYAQRLNLGAIRTDENVLWSFAPHDISIVLALVGGMPSQVSTTGGTYLQATIEDVTTSSLTFAGGVHAHIMVSWLHPFKVQRLVVVGSRKMAVFDDVSPDAKLVLYDKGVELSDGQFSVSRPQGDVVPLPDVEPLREECRHFLECVTTGQRPRTDGQEGLRVLRVLQACQSSLEAHGAWVDLDTVATSAAHD